MKKIIILIFMMALLPFVAHAQSDFPIAKIVKAGESGSLKAFTRLGFKKGPTDETSNAVSYCFYKNCTVTRQRDIKSFGKGTSLIVFRGWSTSQPDGWLTIRVFNQTALNTAIRYLRRYRNGVSIDKEDRGWTIVLSFGWLE